MVPYINSNFFLNYKIMERTLEMFVLKQIFLLENGMGFAKAKQRRIV